MIHTDDPLSAGLMIMSSRAVSSLSAVIWSFVRLWLSPVAMYLGLIRRRVLRSLLVDFTISLMVFFVSSDALDNFGVQALE